MEKVTFLVSNRCNLKCRHCFVNAGKEIENELPYDEKFKAIDNLFKLGVKKVTFSGGEPLMDKKIFEYIRYAKSKGFKIGFLTNGLLLDDNKIEELKKLVDTFSISFYTKDILGVNAKFYEKYYQKTMDNLKKLTEKDFNFKVTIPISDKNREKVIEMIQILSNENIRPETIRIYMITPLGRGEKNRNICTENYNCSDIFESLPLEIKESDLSISAEYASVNKNNIESSEYYTYCPISNYEQSYINEYGDPHMDANGDLYLCGLLIRNKKYCIGNILNDDIDKIIDNTKEIAKIVKEKKEDCCPVLNRKVKKNEVLVCPVLYYKTKV